MQFNISIDRKGFFILRDDFAHYIYTKSTNLKWDRTGCFSDEFGRKLQGYNCDVNGDSNYVLSDVVLRNEILSPAESTRAQITLNLSSYAVPPARQFIRGFSPGNEPVSTTFNNSCSLQIFDSLGASHTLTMYFVKSQSRSKLRSTWEIYFGMDGYDVTSALSSSPHSKGKSLPYMMTANLNGRFEISTPAILQGLRFHTGAAVLSKLEIDFSNSSCFVSPFSITALEQNGLPPREVAGLSIGRDGEMYIITDQRQTKQELFAKILIAEFPNSQNLTKGPALTWYANTQSGCPIESSPVINGLGRVSSESNNVSKMFDKHQLKV